MSSVYGEDQGVNASCCRHITSAPYGLAFSRQQCVQCTIPGAYTQLHLVPAVTLGRSCYYSYPYLTEEETEAKRGLVTHLGIDHKSGKNESQASLILSCALPAKPHYLLGDHMHLENYVTSRPERYAQNCNTEWEYVDFSILNCFLFEFKDHVFASSLKKTAHSSEYTIGIQLILGLHGNSQKKVQLCSGSENLIIN